MKTIQQSFPGLNKALGIEIYLKREDQHKYGSHKGRSIPFMIKKYHKGDYAPKDTPTINPLEIYDDFVISSSGNAAIAAIHTIQAHNRNNPDKLKLTVFIGEHIDAKKLKLLTTIVEDPRIVIHQVARPKQAALQMEKEGNIKNLRQSTDDSACIGYYELADELNRIPNLQAIFIPTSSGTTVQALCEAFETVEPSRWGGKQNPQIHIVQTTACNTMAKEFDTDFTPTASSIGNAIVDRVGHRKQKVIECAKKTNGSGWVVGDEEIRQAQELVKETANVSTSPNSALSVAGLKKALEKGWKWDGTVVCILTGM